MCVVFIAILFHNFPVNFKNKISSKINAVSTASKANSPFLSGNKIIARGKLSLVLATGGGLCGGVCASARGRRRCGSGRPRAPAGREPLGVQRGSGRTCGHSLGGGGGSSAGCC